MTYNFESLAVIKSHLSACKQTICSRIISDKMKVDISQSYATYKQFMPRESEHGNQTTAAATSNLIQAAATRNFIPAASTSNLTVTAAAATSNLTVIPAAAPATSISVRPSAAKKKQVSLEIFFSKRPRL